MITKEKNWGRSPLLQKSSIGPPSLNSGNPCLYLGLLYGILQSKETLSAFIPSRYLRATFYPSSDPSNSGAYYPRCLNICRWCSLAHGHIIGTIYNWLSGIVIGCAIISISRECTGLNLSSLWSARKTLRLLTGSTKASGLIVSSSSWWFALSVQLLHASWD